MISALKKSPQAYSVIALILALTIFSLFRLSSALYSSEITSFNPEDEYGALLLKGSRLYFDPDAISWMLHAREALKNNTIGVREVTWDSVEAPRPMHWSSPLVWLLTLSAQAANKYLKLQQSQAIEWSQPIAYTILFLAVGVIGAMLAVKGFGPKLGSLIFLLLFLSGNSMWHSFHPFFIDHHGIMTFCVAVYLFSLLIMLGGKDSASKSMIGAVAGIAAGCALWISAITAVPAIVIPLLALGAVLVYTKVTKTTIYTPNQLSGLQRNVLVFGATTAIVSLIAYYIEYGNQLTLRMEVNSPAYAGAMLGGSILLTGLILWQNQQWYPSLTQKIFGLVSLILIAIPIGLLGYFKGEIFTLLDPYWARLPHVVNEGQPVDISELFNLGLMSTILLFIIISHGYKYPKTLQHLLPLLITLIVFGAMLMTARRIYPLFVLALGVYAVGILYLAPNGRFWLRACRLLWILLICHIAVGLIAISQMIVQEQRFGLDKLEEPSEFRVIAEQIVRDSRKTQTQLNILTFPESAPYLAYYTGGRTSGGIYWESIPNFKKSNAILLSNNLQEVEKELKDSPYNYLVLPHKYPRTWTYLESGLKGLNPDPTIFSQQAQNNSLPWLTLLTNGAYYSVYKINKQ